MRRFPLFSPFLLTFLVHAYGPWEAEPPVIWGEKSSSRIFFFFRSLWNVRIVVRGVGSVLHVSVGLAELLKRLDQTGFWHETAMPLIRPKSADTASRGECIRRQWGSFGVQWQHPNIIMRFSLLRAQTFERVSAWHTVWSSIQPSKTSDTNADQNVFRLYF